MLKLKYIFILLIIGFLVALFMPEKYHYDYLGKITSTDTTYHENGNINYITYTYVDDNHRVMKMKIHPKALFESMSADFINKNNDERMYEYRGWTNSFSIIMICLLIMISYLPISMNYECGEQLRCDNCPVYMFCSSKNKVGGFNLKKFSGKND